jgi:4-amino-4-deoxy-L-arabinose transferase-like glycosyltransferase
LRRRPVLALVALAVALRVGHVLVLRDTPILEYHRSFTESDMRMFEGWARTLEAGDWLGRRTYHPLYQWQLAAAPADRWAEWYGRAPTYYKAPFYAYLLAALIRFCGDAALPVALLQSIAAAAAGLLLYEVTRRPFGERAGLCAALLFALYAPAIHFDAVMLRGPWIALGALGVAWRLSVLREARTARAAAAAGVAVGCALLVNEGFGPLPFLVAATVVLWVRAPAEAARLLLGLLAGTALVLAPLALRNWLVGAPVFKLAVTGSTVYAVFNAAGASPYFFEIRPAVFLPVLERSGGALGATVVECLRSFPGPGAVLAFYLRKALGLAVPFENPDNVNFYYVALRSPVLGILPGYAVLLPLAFLGLVLARRRLAALLPLVPPSACIVLTILLTLPLSRYRATLAVLLLPLAGLAAARFLEWTTRRRWAALGLALGGAAAMAAGMHWLEASVVFAGRPAGLHRYRPPEFWIGVGEQERRGAIDAAVREALDLGRFNPDAGHRLWVLLTVARLEAGRGRDRAAGEAVAGAEQIAATDAARLLQVGDAWSRLLRDEGRAQAAYRRALDLGPTPTLRAALERRLARRLE